jgi:uncharacterized caspase-like protein
MKRTRLQTIFWLLLYTRCGQRSAAASAAPFAGRIWGQTPGRTLQAAPRPSSPSIASASGGLLIAPRRALVIGNSSYTVGPLKNPANDAKAIGDELARQGFEVTLGLDLKRDEMLQLIGAYGQALARTKPVALFYFAGHGLQLAWRNYLVPVDAMLKGPKDVQAQCVDVNAVIERIGKAANPMNVIVLDACRDDPYGRAEQKGLSQLDAPPGTLLAFATSPGNVASDGDGANGLYTENLLREMKVPEAKIEDVFKRVRLAVRRRSNGRQIPWESTSLEEDFWFIPPKELKKLADEEAGRLFLQEIALWEKADGAKAAAPLEEYLRRYPSGRFAELAQLQLDAILARDGEKRIEVVTSAQNPYTQGFARADLAYKAGDSYSYVQLDRDTREEQRRFTTRVTKVTDTEVIFSDGAFVQDRLGNIVRLPDGRRFTPRQDQPLEYVIGKKWSTRFSVATAQGGGGDSAFDFRITRREKITVPAGTFDCFVIEGEGYTMTTAGFKVQLGFTRWVAPDKVRRPIVIESFRKFEGRTGPPALKKGGGFGKKGPPGGILENERLELTAFEQS